MACHRLPATPATVRVGAFEASIPPVLTIEPGEHGGNVDLKELVAGTSLFLPVWAPGALFSTGDGHGRQGDGEVCINALKAVHRLAFLGWRMSATA